MGCVGLVYSMVITTVHSIHSVFLLILIAQVAQPILLVVDALSVLVACLELMALESSQITLVSQEQ
jgi:hypothetical protein